MMVTASHPLAGPVARPSHTQARMEGPVPAQGEDAGCVSGVSGMGPDRAGDRPLSKALSLSGSVGLPTCLAETLPGPSEAIPAPLRLCVQASVNQDTCEGRLCWGRVMNLTCLGASPAPQSLSLE